ncbi:MAG TPA: type VI secretion system baseplate subunit TssK [Bryobacteraceae bacterium]|nr:type VI secretion system baseplate subunit TssK [Bryobacteraceae bacterium]
MKFLSRVVWSEGMYLGPHHFQAQSRYFEDSIQFATSSLWFEPFGLVGLEIDANALKNGTISIVNARGIFPDGLPFHMPECDPLPPVRNIAELFPPTRDTLTVLMAIAPRQPDGINCALSDAEANGARFIAEARTLHDENTGRDEKPVQLGRKNIKLLLDTEPATDLLTMPVARIMRDGSGHFIPDPRFIPPVIQIGASERLLVLLRRLIEILEDKSSSITGSRKTAGTTLAEFSTREIANFWLLHTVNSSLAPLRHLCFSKRGHPEELYVELARLGGALCTFALDSHPRALPLYDHQHLDQCFEALDHHIRTHLETIVPTNCISIPLTHARDYFWEGDVSDSRVLGRSQWVFALHSRAGEAAVIQRTPQLVKVCSSQFVGELVKRALPGCALTHLPVPPPAISAKVETQYFSVSKAGPCWDHIGQTRRVGIYVPGELPEPELELLVVLET